MKFQKILAVTQILFTDAVQYSTIHNQIGHKVGVLGGLPVIFPSSLYTSIPSITNAIPKFAQMCRGRTVLATLWLCKNFWDKIHE